MGLKDFFTKRKLKKAAKVQNGESNGSLLSQPSVCDDIICSLWTKCTSCKELLYTSELKKNLSVCKHCNFHNRISSQERIDMLTDYGSFFEIDSEILPDDPLSFVDLKAYKDRLKDAKKTTGVNEAIITGFGNINQEPVAIGSMEFQYIGGSMGSVVGEKITRLVENAIAKKLPLIIISSSGGARMHEGIISLMQMAKTASSLKSFHDAKLLYISVLTEPTFGGVTASFSMLGDIIIAEPQARIGFAGRRVIEETIRQKLPKNFQTAEYLLENGQIDMVVPRTNLKSTISELIRLHTQNNISKDFEEETLKQLSREKSLTKV